MLESGISDLIAAIKQEISAIKTMLRMVEVIPTLATKHDLEELFKKIMSLVSDAIDAFVAQIQPDVDAINTNVQNIVTGVNNLQALILSLQSTVGGNPDLDQASKDKLAAVVTAVAALATATAAIPPMELPPTGPVATPTPAAKR